MYPYVEGQTLRSCLAEQETALHRQQIECVWRQLGRLWKRLRQLRVSLSDANAGNFIVGAQGKLWVIDLDKARFHRLAYAAARNQQQRWQQLLRSAAKC
jgi:hypothetical protein